MNRPAVTVLLPAYNAGGYIAEAVESVLSQTFSDFELLIINDGSTDQTASVLKLHEHDPRVRVLHQENRGLVRTLNRGLDEARASLIARFDADDVCLPQRLELQTAYMDSHPDCVLLGSDAEYMDEQGTPLFRFHCAAYDDDGIRKQVSVECPLIHSSVMYRKDAVLQAGGYDAAALTFEDHLLWKNLLQYGTAANIPQALIKVRFNPASVTVDERWRGPQFKAIKQRSIDAGVLSAEDTEALRTLLQEQNFTAFKEAAYHSMIGKKYLWNNPQPSLAREHLRKAIRSMPRRVEPYALYMLSFLPSRWIQALYHRMRQPSSSPSSR